jgi:hypothetical protein
VGLWFEARIGTDGLPVTNGFHCGDVNRDLDAARALARRGLIAPRPDFIIKNGSPFTTDPVLHPNRNYDKAFLIGDIKITVRAARRTVESRRPGQWRSMMEYAQYRSGRGHQYVPVALYFTFYGDRHSDVDIAYIQRKSAATPFGVRTEVSQIVSKR